MYEDAKRELKRLTNCVQPSDLYLTEILALIAILGPVGVRLATQSPPPELRLVNS